uniref:tyrosine-protein kinase JAK2-like n=1 Tax=Styela clava TaxID=7725 RepID=UPI001939643F|nr:tyrosine-protein kinase JAK2-like [Styela clava]
MSIPVKVFIGKTLINGAKATIDDLLVNSEIVEFPVIPGDTYDNLLTKCGIKCHISPLYLSMFAIWNPVDKSWMNLSNVIDMQDKHLEFRIRFVVKTEMQIGGQKKVAKRWAPPGETSPAFMDDTLIAYYYRQRRDDFLLDKIKFSIEESSQTDLLSAALGVVVLDMMCMSKAGNMDVSAVRRRVNFKKLLPKSCRHQMSEFNFCNKIRVKNKFDHYLRYFSPTAQIWDRNGYSLAFFHQRYLLNLELFSASYGVERYDLAKSGYITVSGDSGITLHSDESEENAEKWCDFSELTDMTLKTPANLVSLGKFDGSVKKFAMKSEATAENLASCIDGYYRLLVDAHHYLCKEVSSPSFIDQLSLGCHGPITRSFAEDLLRKREAKGIVEVGDCIIRQTHDSYDEYYVNTVCHTSPLEIRNFKLDRGRNSQLGLFGWVQSHKHRTLVGLLHACEDGRYDGEEIPINPSRKVFPQSKHKSNLLVRLCSSAEDRDSEDYDVHGIVPRTVLIRLEDYSHVHLLSNGNFTDVKRYTRRGEIDRYVVFKTIIDQRPDDALHHHINISLQESTAVLNRLNHQHIVQHIGMTLNNMVAFEHIRFGSITTYLQSDRRNEVALNPTWRLQVLWQITRACHYLEELGFAHGNLQGKNVLLQSDYPQPHIKLSDAGVLTRIRTIRVSETNRRQIVEPRLTSPWLGYEFCFIDHLPQITKYPTIEGDKWSFATTLFEILNSGRITVDPMNGNEMTEDMKTHYRSGSLSRCLYIPELITDNINLFNLICSCWSVHPYRRPSFQKILRELGSTLTSDYVLLPLPAGPVCDIIVELEHDLPTYEDEKLTCQSSLGEGHFGCVELCAYDQYRNNHTELVAVKRSKRGNNRRLQDFTQEIETMRKLNHAYVVRLLGIATPSGRIVMEYLRNGSLAEDLKKRKIYGRMWQTSMLLRFSSQIAEGMIALQQKRIIHRDLALRNILLANDSSNPHIKISDFGLSRFLSEDKDVYVGNLTEFPSQWYPPECLCEEPRKAFQFESDVWSYGVTIWEIFSYGDKPNYKDVPQVTRTDQLKDLHNCLQRNQRLEKPQYCPRNVYQLMLDCWAYAPAERLTFVDVKTKLDSLSPHADQLPF